RLALCEIENGAITRAKTFSTADYGSLAAVIRAYLAEQQQDVKHGCIAIACPIPEDWVEMTNHDWAFSTNSLKATLAFDSMEIINDFTAVSMAIPM
ncbi:glucokinase, partial [Erwinia amylovora]|uniref:glucokinase n=1 Tax=Erwinia amylovora TaxID=552 RepID=UPI00200AD2F6